MAKCFNGLTTVDIKLTNKCDKNCWPFSRQISCVDTKFENDEDGEEQHAIIEKFLRLKKGRKSNVIIRCLGKFDKEFGSVVPNL